MGGMFGGLLGLLNLLGGGVLFLLIGTPALEPNNQVARWWRLIIGSLIIGPILGCVIFRIIYTPSTNIEYIGGQRTEVVYPIPATLYIPASIFGAIGLAFLVLVLEFIRQGIESKDKKRS
jgi:hypothetical protein